MQFFQQFKSICNNLTDAQIKAFVGKDYRTFLSLLKEDKTLVNSFYRMMVYALLSQPDNALKEINSWKDRIANDSRQLHIWGGRPIINFKYWSNSLKQMNLFSESIVPEVFSINNRDDFDYLYEDFLPAFLKENPSRGVIAPYFVFFYAALYAKTLNISYYGFSLSLTTLASHEAQIYNLLNIKTLVTPYGSDFYMYSRLTDMHEKDGLMRSYPQLSHLEPVIDSRVRYWNRYASFIWGTFVTLCGSSRHDNIIMNPICIDIDHWYTERCYTDSDGSFDKPTVKILHAPNHKGVKGSDLIEKVISEIRLTHNVDLIVVQKEKNETIKYLMQHVDIVIDQLILNGYGMFAIEAMTSGVATIANISNSVLDIFRLRSYLLECPIASADQYSFKDTIISLIESPDLRRRLGKAGQYFSKKYHSYEYFNFIYTDVMNYLEGKGPLQHNSNVNVDFEDYIDLKFLANLKKILRVYKESNPNDASFDSLTEFVAKISLREEI